MDCYCPNIDLYNYNNVCKNKLSVLVYAASFPFL